MNRQEAAINIIIGVLTDKKVQRATPMMRYRFNCTDENPFGEVIEITEAVGILNTDFRALAAETQPQPASGWIRTSDLRPTADDASATGMVMAVKANAGEPYVTVVKWSRCTPRAYPFWMRYPELP